MFVCIAPSLYLLGSSLIAQFIVFKYNIFLYSCPLAITQLFLSSICCTLSSNSFCLVHGKLDYLLQKVETHIKGNQKDL